MPILNVIQIFTDGVAFDYMKKICNQLVNRLKCYVGKMRKGVKCMKKIVILLICLWIHFGGIVGLHNLYRNRKFP